jgi:predicted transporter
MMMVYEGILLIGRGGLKQKEWNSGGNDCCGREGV